MATCPGCTEDEDPGACIGPNWSWMAFGAKGEPVVISERDRKVGAGLCPANLLPFRGTYVLATESAGENTWGLWAMDSKLLGDANGVTAESIGVPSSEIVRQPTADGVALMRQRFIKRTSTLR